MSRTERAGYEAARDELGGRGCVAGGYKLAATDGGDYPVCPAAVKVSRKQAAANALGLLRAEGLEPSAEHEALATRWVAGEIDSEQFERLNLEQVRQRLASGGRALIS
jgi:hypothetical protein